MSVGQERQWSLAGLMLLAFAWKRRIPMLFWEWRSPDHKSPQAALLSAVFRYMGLYLGQMLQCASFAFYMSVSVECFAEAADERLRSSVFQWD